MMMISPEVLAPQEENEADLEPIEGGRYFLLDGGLPLHDATGVFHMSPCSACPTFWNVGVAACDPLCDLLFAAMRLVAVWDIPEKILHCERSKAVFVEQRGFSDVQILGLARDKTRKTKQQVVVFEAATLCGAQRVHAHFEGCKWGNEGPTARFLLSCKDVLEPAWDTLARDASAAPRGPAVSRPDPLSPLWLAPNARGVWCSTPSVEAKIAPPQAAIETLQGAIKGRAVHDIQTSLRRL